MKQLNLPNVLFLVRQFSNWSLQILKFSLDCPENSQLSCKQNVRFTFSYFSKKKKKNTFS